MTSLNILCSDSHNLLEEVTQKKNWKESHKKNLCAIINFQKYFTTHEYLPKIFRDP